MERNSHSSYQTSTSIQDITAWKYPEEQYQFLSTILQYVNDSVIVTDLEGTITWWNNGAHTLFGYTSLENCDELTLLVNAILEALYISGEVHVPHYENLSLAEVVREVLTQLDPRQKAAYSIEVQLPGEISVWADRHFLQQVLRNLFSNAFKYVPQKTPITLSAQRLEGSQGKEAAFVLQCMKFQNRSEHVKGIRSIANKDEVAGTVGALEAIDLSNSTLAIG